MDESQLRKLLTIAFEYSFEHDDWVCPLAEALEGVDAIEAARRPAPKEKGIWDIVLHLALWNENIVERVRTGLPSRPLGGSWPEMPLITDEEAWEGAKARLWKSLESVRYLTEHTPIAQIEASPYGLGDLLCRSIHNAYHIGQITKLRNP